MKRFLAIVLLCAIASTTPAAAIDITGDLIPGGMAVGRTTPGATVLLGDAPVMVGGDGLFVIGFGRDQRATQLTIIHADGRSEQQVLDLAPRAYEIQRIDQLEQNMVTPDPATEARIKADQERVRAARATPSERRDFLASFIWPVEGPISGVYGSQRILNGTPKAPHFGTDIAAPTGSPVVAPADGVVRLAERDLYLTGGTVILDHGHGIYSSYLHLSAVEVAVGQALKQGERLGAVGATGRATGPHLHWGLNWHETRLDPALLVPPMPAGAAAP
ncbi:murein DD-endopeptidase MepM/ murein hydrolase activator NlpD [Dongia mobilis]|uniref:Murein DD-endopeptidase MepM/ murein hydrolase activator NlpD n=1 Tax=Dongia mobilis TaxID=578943 RepID=A0A4R6WKG6_9PROT|nr:M23 family metallopeptidase [Dongia mobilis]TDQ81053.1 murein DD-endopeptidase MepM/ murein hydrolase activator NlpD [Dongia mobilis]